MIKMKALLLVWCFGVVSIGVFSKEQSDDGEILNVGAIFSLATINGKVSQIAMKAAVEDVNLDGSILVGRILSLQIHDSNFSGFLSMMGGALQFMKMDTVAIIGPQSSVMAHVLSHLANRLHVPLLSFTALDPELSPIQYPFFLQTAPSDLFQMAAIAELVSYFHWSQVTAVFTDDDQSRNAITSLGDQLTDRNCKISYKAALPPDQSADADEHTITNALKQIMMMESRVIVVHTTTVFGPRLFRAANELGMMSQGYVWIATSWLSTVLDAGKKNINVSFDGVLTLRPNTPDTKRRRAFISRWENLSNGSIGLPVSGLYAYDTVWMLARALDVFFKRGNNVSFSDDPVLAAIGGGTLNLSALSVFNGGDELLKLLLETDMTGVTGPIRYVDEDRSMINPGFDVLNVVVGNQMKQIGYWFSNSGLSIDDIPLLTPYNKTRPRSVSNDRLGDVVWPGGGTEKPRGWIFRDNGRKLRIGVPHRVSFYGLVLPDNHSHVVNGFCIDVFRAAARLLPYPLPFEFVLFGDGHQNPNYNDLVNRITTNEFDAVVGDVAIVTSRTKMVDFTQPYVESGLVVLAPAKKLKSSAWAFLQPFTPFMWAVTGIFFLIVGVVIWILEHRLNDEFRGPPREQIMTILWFSFSTMFFAHRENTVSTLGRLVMLIWLFVVLIVQSSYTASLTSILTVQQLSSPIQGIDSLITSSAIIGYQVGSFAENYLREELGIPRYRLRALNSPKEYALALANRTVAVVVDERPYVELFLAKHCQFVIVGSEFTKGGWGFAFPRGSPLAVDMSTALLQLSEDGALQNITQMWQAKLKTLCKAHYSDDDADQLQLNNFIGLFLLSGIACLVSLGIYFFKVVYEYKRHRPAVHSSPVDPGSRPARIRTFLSFVDKKEDKLEDSARRMKRKRASMSSVNDRGGKGVRGEGFDTVLQRNNTL